MPCTQKGGMEVDVEQTDGVAHPQEYPNLALWDDVGNRGGAGLGPEARFVLDGGAQVGDRGLGPVEGATVSMLPNPPSGEDDEGGQSFTRGSGREGSRRCPPRKEVGVLGRQIRR